LSTNVEVVEAGLDPAEGEGGRVAGQAVELAGRLALVADHLVLALREEHATDGATFVVSWYHVAFSRSGAGGNLAFVRSPALPDGELVITDSPSLDHALRERLQPRSWPLTDPSREAVAGTFERSPVRDGAVTARIVAGGHTLELAWLELGVPIVANGRVGPADAPWDTSTVLIEAGGWSATLDGAPVAGRPFPNHVWDAWFGRPLSSALVAVAEVFREVAP
jgi:hypothetical protein